MKSYVKPDLYYEDFELSSHIATCTIELSNASAPETCGGTAEGFGGAKVFMITPACDVTDYEEYCYTNGGSEFVIFRS